MTETEMLSTKAGDPGAFRDFDLSRVPSPCFVVDEKAVERNLAILRDVADRSGARVLSALKQDEVPAQMVRRIESRMGG